MSDNQDTQPKKAKTEKPAKTEPIVLHGAMVTIETVKKAVNNKFPAVLYAQNYGRSTVAFPCIRTAIEPYARDFALTLKPQNEAELFCVNYSYYVELWGWDDTHGVILSPSKQGE